MNNFPKPHTYVNLHLSTGETVRGYYNGVSRWFRDDGHAEVRVMGWSA